MAEVCGLEAIQVMGDNASQWLLDQLALIHDRSRWVQQIYSTRRTLVRRRGRWVLLPVEVVPSGFHFPVGDGPLNYIVRKGENAVWPLKPRLQADLSIADTEDAKHLT